MGNRYQMTRVSPYAACFIAIIFHHYTARLTLSRFNGPFCLGIAVEHDLRAEGACGAGAGGRDPAGTAEGWLAGGGRRGAVRGGAGAVAGRAGSYRQARGALYSRGLE